jgi:prepilin-type N-terminal cleavage/methylation domain-containing protein
MHKGVCSTSGFTLVEVMVAIIIFAVVMVGSFVFFSYGRIHIAHSAHERMALELIKEKIEECKALGGCSDLSDENITLGGVGFTRNTTVSSKSGDGEYDELTVEVNWKERGKTHSRDLVTIIAQ